jgi:hypothetical protein
LRFLLRLAADLRLPDRHRYDHSARALDETGRLIGRWTKAQTTDNAIRLTVVVSNVRTSLTTSPPDTTRRQAATVSL